MTDYDNETVIDFRDDKESQAPLGERVTKELEQLSYKLNLYIHSYDEQRNESVDQIYEYFKGGRKDLSIISSIGAIIGAIGYVGTEVASKTSSILATGNKLNLAHNQLRGAANVIAPIVKHAPLRNIGRVAHYGTRISSIHHGARRISSIHHGAHLKAATVASSHATGSGVSSILLPLFTATIISAAVAMVCYELYQRNEKDMAKYVNDNMNKSPELKAYIDQVNKDSGAIDRFKKGEHPGFKDIAVMTDLTGKYLYGKSSETMNKINEQAQSMILSTTKYLNSEKGVRI